MRSSSPRQQTWLRLLALGLGVLVLGVLVAACGGGSSSSSAESSPSATEEGGAGSEEGGAEEAASNEEGASNGGEAGESVEGKTVSLVTCEPNVYCHAYNENLKRLLGERGVKVTQLSDNFEPELQNQHMDQAIAAKPDLIAVFASNADAIVPALARAKAAGIATANLDARLGEEGEEYVDFEIVADNHALGEFAAENLIEGMEKAGYDKGRVIVVTGTMGTLIVEDRMEAFEEVMAEHPEFEVTDPQDGNWDPVESSKIALQLFTKYRGRQARRHDRHRVELHPHRHPADGKGRALGQRHPVTDRRIGTGGGKDPGIPRRQGSSSQHHGERGTLHPRKLQEIHSAMRQVAELSQGIQAD
jgi:ABC-type sugar transport system substrate-binding protein